jgi:hypothetical protein
MFTVDAKAWAEPLGLWKPRTRAASKRPERPFSASWRPRIGQPDYALAPVSPIFTPGAPGAAHSGTHTNRSGTETWSRWLGCRLPCRSILDLDRPPSEADHRSQLPKLMALYPNSLISLWIRLRHDPFEARPLTERDRWTGSDLEWQLLVWQCCSPDAHRRSAMPMWDRTPAAASTPAQTLMWDRSTRRRSTKARSWQNGLDDR